jgi:hypothetical protein
MNNHFIDQKSYNYMSFKGIFLKFSLFLFLNLWCSTSFSQSYYLNVGASYSKLDFTLNNIDGWTGKYYKAPLLGYSFSTGIEYFEHKFFSLSSDLFFFQSGGKYSKDELNAQYVSSSDHEIAANDLSLGSSFNFNPLNKKLKLQFSLGPRIDYLINGGKIPLYNKWDLNRNGYKKTNFGITTGIGFYYNLHNFVTGINFQYLYKLKKFVESVPTGSPKIPYIGTDAKEHTFSVGISLRLPVKKGKN